MPTLLTIIEQDRKTGALSIQDGFRTAFLLCREGRVVSARIEVRCINDGEEAVYDMLGITDGEFDFEPRPVGKDLGNIDKSVQYLLMEGLRRQDEAKS